ncbi:MAG: ATP-grasp domain-containing protein [Archaeoglobus sp.]|nr:ATP-grasp domain-containing protein [Archaeoglobus sp.]
MEVFLFEYVTAGGEVPEGIIVEGLGMFKSFYSGFHKVLNKVLKVDKVNSVVKPEYLSVLSFPCKVKDDRDIEEWVKELAEKSDCFLIIAPEDDNLLLNLTKIAEKRSENLGSESKGIEITSDKWKTYRKLKNKVNMPETSEKALDPPFVIKPRISCGGEGIEIIKTEKEILKFEDLGTGYIAQELVDGRNLSASLIVGDEIRLISINDQLIENFRYKGAEVPARIGEKDFKDVLSEAIEAAGCIEGLHGYVGIDLVLADVPYVIEINARPTTPSILFEKVYGFSLPDLILKNHFGLGISWAEVEDTVKRRIGLKESFVLKKVEGSNRNFEKVVEYGGYALAYYKKPNRW